MANPQSPIPPLFFDRSLVRQRHVRATEDFLVREMETRLREREEELRHRAERWLHLGPPGTFARTHAGRVAMDEEWLPFAPASFDRIVSCGALHWVNDLPGALAQLRRVLAPGGLFLALFPGGATLHELRDAIAQASVQEEEGLAPRLSPFVDVRDAGALLARVGFSEPVADSETLTVRYANAFALMRDLRAMGETNALLARPRHFTRRSTLLGAADIYRQRYGDGEGCIPATFELVGMTGWG